MAKFDEHFEGQEGDNLVCVVRERIPGRPGGIPDEYVMKLKFVSRKELDSDLAGYLFHHYSMSGGLPVFDEYKGSR